MMTWGEFKQAIERQGVKDNNRIIYIDYDPIFRLRVDAVESENDGILSVVIDNLHA